MRRFNYANKKKAIPTAKDKAKAMVSKEPLNEVQKKQIKRMVKAPLELKYHSKNWNGQTFGTSGNYALFDLCDIPQNTTDNGRIGDRVELSSFEYTFTIYPYTVTAAHTIRIIFFQYKPNLASTLPTLDQILDNGPTAMLDSWSPYDFDFRTDYTILSDKMYQMNPGSTTAVVTKGRTVLRTSRAKKDITFTAGSVFGANHIYCVFMTQSPISTPPAVYGRSRIFFKDG